ncbi:MAG TPA: metallophosphoesterase [Bryobacteraceae bacterium]|nr:metallophosphoesterase [Bryobacteraceae bacterium]
MCQVDNHEWTGGKAHLVQVGDVVDRGADSRQCLDLLMALEKQARAAGGAVHALVGNHEAMNMYGDLRYVSPGDFTAFQDRNSERLRERRYQEHVKELRRAGKPKPDDAYNQQWMSARPPGWFERLAAFSPAGRYGRWIARHNTIIRINDAVFVHGGIGPKYAGAKIRELNDRAREELRDPAKLEGGILMDPEGPFWYRGLATGDEAALASHVDTVLERLGAGRMVVGHTPTGGTVVRRFGGKVILIDTGVSKAYGSHAACLLIESGLTKVLYPGPDLP